MSFLNKTGLTRLWANILALINSKVDKVEGKGLSTNDFTNTYKDKLDGLDNIVLEETDPTVPAWAKTETKPTYTAEEVGALPDSTKISDLEDEFHLTVTPAEKEDWNSKSTFSGNYSDLNGKPSIVNSLDSTSTTDALSAAQGKALKTAIDSITTDLGDMGGGDMMKATYDTDGDGIVDNSSRLEGHAANYFATAEHTHDLANLNEDTNHRTVSDTEKTAWNNKVTQVEGKQLSTNDFTDELKTKLEDYSSKTDELEQVTPLIIKKEYASYAEINEWIGLYPYRPIFCYDESCNSVLPLAYVHQDGAYFIGYTCDGLVELVVRSEGGTLLDSYMVTDRETDPTVPNHVKKITPTDITNWNNKSNFDGNYDNLTNKPTIPTKTSDLTNDAGFITQDDVSGFGGGDMMKATYDTDGDGVVDNASKLGGHDADYFASWDHLHDLSDIGEDENHRSVTDAEKTAWNNKVDSVEGKQLSTNDFTDLYKERINSNASIVTECQEELPRKADKFSFFTESDEDDEPLATSIFAHATSGSTDYPNGFVWVGEEIDINRVVNGKLFYKNPGSSNSLFVVVSSSYKYENSAFGVHMWGGGEPYLFVVEDAGQLFPYTVDTYFEGGGPLWRVTFDRPGIYLNNCYGNFFKGFETNDAPVSHIEYDDFYAGSGRYAYCSTSASVAEKKVNISNFTLTQGKRVLVEFSYDNTATNPLLNVNNTGAKPIKYKGSAIEADKLKKDLIYEFVVTNYGSAYDIIGTLGEADGSGGGGIAVETDPTVPEWAKQPNKPTYTKEDVGLGNVDNTSDANKPVSAATQTAINELKEELSEAIESESEEWHIVDNNGNIIATIDASGFHTTEVAARNIIINGFDIEALIEAKVQAYVDQALGGN